LVGFARKPLDAESAVELICRASRIECIYMGRLG
jgi:hypothetical protein